MNYENERLELRTAHVIIKHHAMDFCLCKKPWKVRETVRSIFLVATPDINVFWRTERTLHRYDFFCIQSRAVDLVICDAPIIAFTNDRIRLVFLGSQKYRLIRSIQDQHLLARCCTQQDKAEASSEVLCHVTVL
jgi:hypothetical protein